MENLAYQEIWVDGELLEINFGKQVVENKGQPFGRDHCFLCVSIIIPGVFGNSSESIKNEMKGTTQYG